MRAPKHSKVRVKAKERSEHENMQRRRRKQLHYTNNLCVCPKA